MPNNMTRHEAIKIIKKYQSWRLGTEEYQFQDPKVITEAIDFAVDRLENERLFHARTWDAAIQAHDDRGHVHARSLCDFDDYEVK